MGSTNTENKRIQYIDIAKTLGIILVIAGHIVSSDTEIKKVIYSFHMPLFFMLSGMLLKVKDQYNALTWRDLIEKKLKSLMVPYVIWALFYASFSVKHLLFVLYGTRETLIKAESLSSLWFLPAMFIAFMIVELVLQASIKSKKEIAIGNGILGCFLIRGSMGYRHCFYCSFIYACRDGDKANSRGLFKYQPIDCCLNSFERDFSCYSQI